MVTLGSSAVIYFEGAQIMLLRKNTPENDGMVNPHKYNFLMIKSLRYNWIAIQVKTHLQWSVLRYAHKAQYPLGRNALAQVICKTVNHGNIMNY